MYRRSFIENSAPNLYLLRIVYHHLSKWRRSGWKWGWPALRSRRKINHLHQSSCYSSSIYYTTQNNLWICRYRFNGKDSLNTKKTTTYDFGNLGPGFGPTQKCGGIKQVNGIPALPCKWSSLPVACPWLVFSPDTPASSTTKTDRHDIAEILHF
jgi:hypothetical protein